MTRKLFHILLAAFFSLLLAGCANDVDPKLNARKAALEKQIAKYTAYLEKMAWTMAARGGGMAVDYMNKKLKPDDLVDTGLDTRNVYVATQRLNELHKELAEVNKEIERQKMIAPNLLVDVMAEKHYDQVSNPHVFSHNPNPGVSVPVVTPTVTTGHGH